MLIKLLQWESLEHNDLAFLATTPLSRFYVANLDDKWYYWWDGENATHCVGESEGKAICQNKYNGIAAQLLKDIFVVCGDELEFITKSSNIYQKAPMLECCGAAHEI